MEKLIEQIKKLKMPLKWEEAIDHGHIEIVYGGKSGVSAYKLTDSNGHRYLMKVTDHPDRAKELAYENHVLSLLENMYYSPKMYFSIVENGIGLSIREYIDGNPLDQWEIPVSEMVTIASKLLKDIHETKVKSDALKSYTERVKDSKENVLNGNGIP